MLDCVMYLMDQSGLSYHARGDAVKVARKISAIVSWKQSVHVLFSIFNIAILNIAKLNFSMKDHLNLVGTQSI